MNKPLIDRRAFVTATVSAAGGLAIGVPVMAQAAAAGMRKVSLNDGQAKTKELTAWLVIDPDNTVTIRIPHQEMGQGTSTPWPCWWPRSWSATGPRCASNTPRPTATCAKAASCTAACRPWARRACARR